MEYISKEDRSKLKYPEYWNREPNTWGTLGDELRCLKQLGCQCNLWLIQQTSSEMVLTSLKPMGSGETTWP
ncbi:12916_t:CDS:2 [Funneliformis geosporum]|uniref:12916_t:CDS:1 n=1 Tax=Funneliformis geosporum TaxID=1117311 RepID=A0A9W4SR76_9GLOM|nr:12916_t:CDS:2 [Funneliformis geosporum]